MGVIVSLLTTIADENLSDVNSSQKRYRIKFTLNQCLTYNVMLSQELEQQATK